MTWKLSEIAGIGTAGLVVTTLIAACIYASIYPTTNKARRLYNLVQTIGQETNVTSKDNLFSFSSGEAEGYNSWGDQARVGLLELRISPNNNPMKELRIVDYLADFHGPMGDGLENDTVKLYNNDSLVWAYSYADIGKRERKVFDQIYGKAVSIGLDSLKPRAKQEKLKQDKARADEKIQGEINNAVRREQIRRATNSFISK